MGLQTLHRDSSGEMSTARAQAHIPIRSISFGRKKGQKVINKKVLTKRRENEEKIPRRSSASDSRLMSEYINSKWGTLLRSMLTRKRRVFYYL